MAVKAGVIHGPAWRRASAVRKAASKAARKAFKLMLTRERQILWSTNLPYCCYLIE